ncbi:MULTISPECIES: relaxase/mobilization nuclease domain-containing protein [Vibrio]|uniref:Relaxase/mobilization nuclease domain-containing protein n=1 Tax=Vibrio gigantis TaxID=296199 RepID=A0A5M9NP60_9VIBR|nr:MULTISPECIES: relaxase/mobilization nuclease domain-containing protein [Vibrio]KAA8672348.1 relaxase/mobilization nuclease domain-containing protein [Vibrio gigantis]TCT50264.1 relaxase/mobilization nuclease-like protein [Vibrio crassostreae]TCT75288.1 relaxase/mobilization nuclease-like protein [Vibrio crassostreae]TCT94287.1 relaxase/mobilization nuclease-like protein [Vibrio crassostreae]
MIRVRFKNVPKENGATQKGEDRANYIAGTTKDFDQLDGLNKANYVAGKTKDDHDPLCSKTEFLTCGNIASPLPTLMTPFLPHHQMDWSHIGREIGSVKSLKGLLKDPIHEMISLREGEHLTRKQWLELVRSYVKQMGLSGAKYISFIHRDTKKEHCHLVFSGVDAISKKVINHWQDQKTATKLMRKYEKKYSLEAVANPGDKLYQDVTENYTDKKKSGKSKYARATSDKARIARAIDNVISQNNKLDYKPTLLEFLEQLELAGVASSLTYRKLGDKHPAGISFRLSRIAKKSLTANNGNNSDKDGTKITRNDIYAAKYIPGSKMGHGGVYKFSSLLETGCFALNDKEASMVRQMNIKEGARKFGISPDPDVQLGFNQPIKDSAYCNVVCRYKLKDEAKVKAAISAVSLPVYERLFNQSGEKNFLTFNPKLRAFVVRVKGTKRRWHKFEYNQRWSSNKSMTKGEFNALVNQRMAEMLIEFIERILQMFGIVGVEMDTHAGDYQKQDDFKLKHSGQPQILHEDDLEKILSRLGGGDIEALTKNHDLSSSLSL